MKLNRFRLFSELYFYEIFSFYQRLFYWLFLFFRQRCNTDLTDNDVEVSVVQGVNYNVPNPKEVDTYVKLQFPWPTVSILETMKTDSILTKSFSF